MYDRTSVITNRYSISDVRHHYTKAVQHYVNDVSCSYWTQDEGVVVGQVAMNNSCYEQQLL